ncbi:hypothetical protein QUC31_002056 [Theobroma cacao]
MCVKVCCSFVWREEEEWGLSSFLLFCFGSTILEGVNAQVMVGLMLMQLSMGLTKAPSLLGEACGACYQLRCDYRADPKWCLRRASVTITATNFCPSNNNGGWCNPPHHHFDMSMPAFLRIAWQGNEGIVPVLYRRVPCRRRGGVRFTLKGQSSFNLVMISNVGGSGNVKAAWIRGSRTRTWLPMHRNWGVNWQSSVDLRNQRLSFKLTLVDGKTLEFLNVVPSTWKFGQTFASPRQFY